MSEEKKDNKDIKKDKAAAGPAVVSDSEKAKAKDDKPKTKTVQTEKKEIQGLEELPDEIIKKLEKKQLKRAKKALRRKAKRSAKRKNSRAGYPSARLLSNRHTIIR